MSFILFLVGFAIFTGGICWALIVAGVAPLYVVIAAVIFIGIGVIAGVSRTRAKDPA